MNWFKRFFNKKKDVKQHNITATDLESSSLNIDGSFIKAKDFEKIWIAEKVHGDYGASNFLTDNDYIDYHIWEDQNYEKMYKKHLPDNTLIRGNNPNIIFHGGCLGCVSQRDKGIDRCKGCQYFKFDGGKPNLYIEE